MVWRENYFEWKTHRRYEVWFQLITNRLPHKSEVRTYYVTLKQSLCGWSITLRQAMIIANKLCSSEWFFSRTSKLQVISRRDTKLFLCIYRDDWGICRARGPTPDQVDMNGTTSSYARLSRFLIQGQVIVNLSISNKKMRGPKEGSRTGSPQDFPSEDWRHNRAHTIFAALETVNSRPWGSKGSLKKKANMAPIWHCRQRMWEREDPRLTFNGRLKARA